MVLGEELFSRFLARSPFLLPRSRFRSSCFRLAHAASEFEESATRSGRWKNEDGKPSPSGRSPHFRSLSLNVVKALPLLTGNRMSTS
jgi:hypothetical protein